MFLARDQGHLMMGTVYEWMLSKKYFFFIFWSICVQMEIRLTFHFDTFGAFPLVFMHTMENLFEKKNYWLIIMIPTSDFISDYWTRPTIRRIYLSKLNET